MSRHWLLRATGLAIALAGLAFAIGLPRLVLTNATLRVEYPPLHALGALATMAGLALLAAALRGAARWIVAVLALGAALGAIDLARYRVEVGDAAFECRQLLGTVRLAWGEVTRVDSDADRMILEGAGKRIEVPTGRFDAQQRASLERAVSRRLQARSR